MSLSSLTIRQLLSEARQKLDAARVDAPANTSRVLLAQAMGQSKAWLAAHDEDTPAAEAIATFQNMLQRVMAHEPFFYVLGHREFYGLDLLVDPRVLIPRPETEMLVELALEQMKTEDERRKTEITSPPSPVPRLMDVGTGSGAVPIAIAKRAPQVQLIATDVSGDALDVARENARRHGVADRITFLQANLLDGVPEGAEIVTANLPYVSPEEIDVLPPEIAAHEPRVALDGTGDGLGLIRKLLTQIAARPGIKAAFLEFGASQGRDVLAAAQQLVPSAHAEIKKDLAGLDRVLILHRTDGRRRTEDGQATVPGLPSSVHL